MKIENGIITIDGQKLGRISINKDWLDEFLTVLMGHYMAQVMIHEHRMPNEELSSFMIWVFKLGKDTSGTT